MSIPKRALAAILLAAGPSFAASDLDKPIEPTRPTIRTEIYRGRVAAGSCGIETARLMECVFAIQNKNVQQNTATDAFNAGLYFSAWLLASIHVESVKKATGQDEGVEIASRLFRKMKEYQTKLRIDNRALCEATQVNCAGTLPSMEDWGAR
jgi:hypothetical protein